mgnify:CR=1 FL=1
MKHGMKKLWKLIAGKYDDMVRAYPCGMVVCLTFMVPAFTIWASYQIVMYWGKYLKIGWEPALTLFTLATMLGMSIHGVLILAGVFA